MKKRITGKGLLGLVLNACVVVSIANLYDPSIENKDILNELSYIKEFNLLKKNKIPFKESRKELRGILNQLIAKERGYLK